MNIDNKLYIEDFVQYTDNVIDLYVNHKKSMNSIAKEINANYYIVRKILRQNNIERRTGPETNWKEFDEHWLDSIDNEEKLYFLGFLMADGNIYKNKIAFCILQIDEEILVEFNKLLKGNSIIHHRKSFTNKEGYKSAPSCSIAFHSPYMTARLKELGIIERKTLVLEFPQWLTDEQFWPFIRGYFDGDGCFTKKTNTNVKVNIKSSKKFLLELKERLLKYGITSSISKMKNADDRIANLDIQAQDSVRKFMNNIYKNSTIHLSRKYNRYYSYYYENKEIIPY